MQQSRRIAGKISADCARPLNGAVHSRVWEKKTARPAFNDCESIAVCRPFVIAQKSQLKITVNFVRIQSKQFRAGGMDL